MTPQLSHKHYFDWPCTILGTLIVLLTLVVYARTAAFPFIVYDDPGYVYENVHVRSGLSWEGVKWAFTTRERANWHPLTWLSHMLDSDLYGMRAGGHHVTNAILHALSALLVFLWLRQATNDIYPSALAGLVFGLHPLHVESVAWISERKDVLCAFFFLLALVAYTRYARNSTATSYATTTLCFTLALLSKPMAVTWPFVVLLVDSWPLRRFSRANALKRVTEKLPWLLMSALSCFVTMYVQSAGQAVRSLDHISLTLRLENAVVSYARYLGQTFIPIHLVPFYPIPREGYATPLVIAAGVLVIFISALVLVNLRKYPYAFVGWFWFVGMLVPVIGVVQVGGQAMANRYMYLPQIGLSIAVLWSVRTAIVHTNRVSRVAWVIAPILTVVLAAATWFQLGYWRDSVRLFQHTVDVADSSEARTLLGYSYQVRQEWENALPHYARAVELNPNQVIAVNNIAAIYVAQGRWGDAERQAHRAIATDPAHAAAYLNLGEALEGLGRRDEAVTQYATAARIQPGLLSAYEKLGAAQILLERFEDAAATYQTAVQRAPDRVDFWTNLAIALAGAQRYRESDTAFQHALALAPKNSAARYNYAYMLWRSGDATAAKTELDELLAKDPDHPDGKRLRNEVVTATSPGSAAP